MNQRKKDKKTIMKSASTIDPRMIEQDIYMIFESARQATATKYRYMYVHLLQQY